MRKRHKGVFDWLHDDAATWRKKRWWPRVSQLPLMGVGPSGTGISPLSIAGLVAWYKADAGLVTDGAANFVAASTQYLSTTANYTALDGATKSTMSFWAKRAAAANNVEIGITGGGGNFTAELFNDGQLYLETAGGAYGQIALAGTAQHHVVIVFDGTQSGNSNRLKGYVDGVLQTLAFTGTIPAALATFASTFCVGRNGSGGSVSDGIADSVGIYPGRALAQADVTSLYNAGAGKRFSDLTTAEKVNLSAWYDFSGPGANLLVDASGNGNTLTNNNAVTFTAGIASGSAIFTGDAITTWQDQSGLGNHLTQAVGTKRPTLQKAVVNGRDVVRFDGVDDFLAVAGVVRNQPRHTFLVLKLLADGSPSARIADGQAAGNRIMLYQLNAGGSVTMFSGANGPSVTTGTASFAIVASGFSGAASQERLNNGSLVTGDPSTNNATGLTIGCQAGGAGNFTNMDVEEWIEYDSLLSVANEKNVRDYLNSRVAAF